jgi:tRNA (cmo5U34)-methyltransferase
MSHSVRRHLKVDVEGYDANIRRFIPGYETMIEQAAAAVAAISPRLVLDLGSGTGALAEALLHRKEVNAVELLDVDEEMLGVARRRLEPFGRRARFTLRSFEEPFPACDAVTASLSLHHVPTLEAKAALFLRAHDALPPGGLFVNADATMPADPPERDAVYRAWADHMVSSGIEEAQAWRHFEEWAEEDTYLPLEAELAALAEAGFDARCVWHLPPSTLVVAERL